MKPKAQPGPTPPQQPSNPARPSVQRDRDSEHQRDRDSETQRITRLRDGDDRKDSNAVPPLAERICTLPEAAQRSIQHGWSPDSLFIYARALKAFEITTGTRITTSILEEAFALFWNTVKPHLPPDADFDEYRFDFLYGFSKTRAALGANPLEECIRRAETRPMPKEATRYASPKIKRLVAVCYQLQLLNGEAPFFLSVRSTAKIIGEETPHRAQTFLKGLVRDGRLSVIAPGTPGGTKATRYRFNFQTGAEPSKSGPPIPP